jgi:hypothetical protein
MSTTAAAATDTQPLGEVPVTRTTEAPENAPAAAAASTPETAAGRSKKKRRPYRKEYPASFWYEMCEKFVTDSEKYQENQTKFLKSQDSGALDFEDRQAFGKRLKAYKDGTLARDDSIKRNRKGKYLDVEQCLLAFLETREHFSENGKMAISWPFLLEMAKRYSVALGHPPDDFKASPGWLANVLKRHKMKIDFEVSDEDALFYMESVKRFCKKRKIGSEAQNLSVRLQYVLKKKIGGHDVDDARMEGVGQHDSEELRYDMSFLQQRRGPQNHPNPPPMLPHRDLYRPTPFAAHPPAPPGRNQNGDDRFPQGIAAFPPFWAPQQQNM